MNRSERREAREGAKQKPPSRGESVIAWLLGNWFYVLAVLSAIFLIWGYTAEKGEERAEATIVTTETLAKHLAVDESDIPDPYAVEENKEAFQRKGIKFDAEELTVYDVYYRIDGQEYHVEYWREVMLGVEHLESRIIE